LWKRDRRRRGKPGVAELVRAVEETLSAVLARRDERGNQREDDRHIDDIDGRSQEAFRVRTRDYDSREKHCRIEQIEHGVEAEVTRIELSEHECPRVVHEEHPRREREQRLHGASVGAHETTIPG